MKTLYFSEDQSGGPTDIAIHREQIPRDINCTSAFILIVFTLQIQNSCTCLCLILSQIINTSPATDWDNPPKESEIREGELQPPSVSVLRFTYNT